MKPALLVIDVQKEFFTYSPTTAQSLNDAMVYINVAIALFRECGLPCGLCGSLCTLQLLRSASASS